MSVIQRYWDCGVPLAACSGISPIVSDKYKNRGYRCHTSHAAAVACARAHQKRVGGERPYVQRIKTGKLGRAMVPAIRG
jgi:hypothetical protein